MSQITLIGPFSLIEFYPGVRPLLIHFRSILEVSIGENQRSRRKLNRRSQRPVGVRVESPENLSLAMPDPRLSGSLPINEDYSAQTSLVEASTSSYSVAFNRLQGNP